MHVAWTALLLASMVQLFAPFYSSAFEGHGAPDTGRVETDPAAVPDVKQLGRHIEDHKRARIVLASRSLETGPIVPSAEGVRVRSGKERGRLFPWGEIDSLEVLFLDQPEPNQGIIMMASVAGIIGGGIAVALHKGKDIWKTVGRTALIVVSVGAAADLLTREPPAERWETVWTRGGGRSPGASPEGEGLGERDW